MMRFAGYCRTLVWMVLFLGIALSGRVVSSSESADQDSIQDEVTVDEETVWDEDLDRKLDKTIKILSVIKEELKDIEAVEKDVTAAEAEKKDRINALRDAFRKAVRIWRKVRKTAAPETEQAGQVPASDEREEKWSRDMSDKLDKTIEAMTAMKEELDRMEDE